MKTIDGTRPLTDDEIMDIQIDHKLPRQKIVKKEGYVAPLRVHLVDREGQALAMTDEFLLISNVNVGNNTMRTTSIGNLSVDAIMHASVSLLQHTMEMISEIGMENPVQGIRAMLELQKLIEEALDR